LERFTVWTDVWRAVCEAPDQQQALFMALRYVALATEPATMQDLIRKLEPILGESAREVIMTFGEQLIEEGRQRGLAEGEAAGRVQDRADALLRLLALRKLPVSDELRARIETCSDLSTLVRWFDRAATAQSASEAISEA
jgi:flagellar biosynthesis/type III secretory pathway protein FliH